MQKMSINNNNNNQNKSFIKTLYFYKKKNWLGNEVLGKIIKCKRIILNSIHEGDY